MPPVWITLPLPSSSGFFPTAFLPSLTWTRYRAQRTSLASHRGGPGWSPSRDCFGWEPVPGRQIQVLLAAGPQGSGVGEAVKVVLVTLGEVLALGSLLQGGRGGRGSGNRLSKSLHSLSLPCFPQCLDLLPRAIAPIPDKKSGFLPRDSPPPPPPVLL